VGDRSKVALFKTLGAVMERLPERVDVAIAKRLATLFGRRSTGARGNLRTNVSHALRVDDHDPDEGLLARFVERGFESYGQYWAEGAKLRASNRARLLAFSHRRRSGVPLRRQDQGPRHDHRVAAHRQLGVGRVVPQLLGLGMTAVAEDLEPPELFAWFKAKRESIGIRIEPLDEHAGTVLLQTLKDGGVVGLLCDRDIQGNGIEVEFFVSGFACPRPRDLGAAHRRDVGGGGLLQRTGT